MRIRRLFKNLKCDICGEQAESIITDFFGDTCMELVFRCEKHLDVKTDLEEMLERS